MGAACFVAATLLLFAFVFWQATSFEVERSDSFLVHEAAAVAREPMAEIARDVTLRFGSDLHRLTFAAVFARDGTPLTGDVLARPEPLAGDGAAHAATVRRRFPNGHIVTENVRAVLLPLADGRSLLIGRSGEAISELHVALAHALAIGLLPGILIALAAGTVASLRALARVGAVNRTVARIIDGDLHERLPTHGTADAVDQLSQSVNRMLDDIERLLGEVKGVSDSVAHDLRTPLTRVRSRLEGGRLRASSLPELEDVVDHAVGDLDQCLAIITALLRIGELEADRRRASFATIGLASMVREAVDLYAPVADERGILLRSLCETDVEVTADRDLLFEALVNLLDNAIKFTPANGQVTVSLIVRNGPPIITVSDTGPGIPESEREAVLKRFYRADPSRRIPGSGLGLSLVAAILRLHDYRLDMRNLEPGFSASIECGNGVAGTVPATPRSPYWKG